MSLGSITLLDTGPYRESGARRYRVASGAVASINAGEFVVKTLGNSTGNFVSKAVSNVPSIGTTYLAGLASTTSTDTATATGSVDVLPLLPGAVYLCAPTTAASWDTQAEYDALVGARVNMTVTSSVPTVNATDWQYNGFVVEPLDIAKYPGVVAFTVRQGAAYNN